MKKSQDDTFLTPWSPRVNGVQLKHIFSILKRPLARYNYEDRYKQNYNDFKSNLSIWVEDCGEKA